MFMLVNCSNCRTALQLPPGARSIRCAVCQAITHIAEPRDVPPPSTSHYAPSNAPPPPAPPSPYHHAPPGPPPNAHGRKKAVICGISYRYSRHELKGCINDAKCMRFLLINKFKFPEDSILMLTGTPCFLYTYIYSWYLFCIPLSMVFEDMGCVLNLKISLILACTSKKGEQFP